MPSNFISEVYLWITTMLYKVVTLFAKWDKCSEGIARIKVECKIKAIEDTLNKVIKSLQDV